MSVAKNGDAVLPGDIARRVIDPHAYAQWDGLLDTFDHIRSTTPVAKVQSDTPGLFDPFWLVTRYDDVMRISKDNATFLNAPRPTVFTNRAGEALAGLRADAWRGVRWIRPCCN